MDEWKIWNHAIGAHWRLLLSGTGSIVIGVAQYFVLGFVHDTNTVRKVLLVLFPLVAFGCFYCAFFYAWRDEHRKVAASQPLAQAFLESLKVRCDQLIKKWSEVNQLCENNLQDPLMPTWASSEMRHIPFKVGSLQMLYDSLYGDMVRALIPIPEKNVRISLPDLLETLRDCKGNIDNQIKQHPSS
jgi:hypothetical protein